MAETIPENKELKRLRECISTVHYLKQAKEFSLISNDEFDSFIKNLSEETKGVAEKVVASVKTG